MTVNSGYTSAMVTASALITGGMLPYLLMLVWIIPILRDSGAGRVSGFHAAGAMLFVIPAYALACLLALPAAIWLWVLSRMEVIELGWYSVLRMAVLVVALLLPLLAKS